MSTKQKDFRKFNLAGYYSRKSWDKLEQSGWYLLTHWENFKTAIKAFKCHSRIEARFEDCKTGGYNVKSIYAIGKRLIAVI